MTCRKCCKNCYGTSWVDVSRGSVSFSGHDLVNWYNVKYIIRQPMAKPGMGKIVV